MSVSLLDLESQKSGFSFEELNLKPTLSWGNLLAHKFRPRECKAWSTTGTTKDWINEVENRSTGSTEREACRSRRPTHHDGN